MKKDSIFKFGKIILSLKNLNKFFKNRNNKNKKLKNSFARNISKLERYKNLIEKFNQFKTDEFKSKKSKKTKNVKEKFSIIKKVNLIQNLNFKSKLENKISKLKEKKFKFNKILFNKFKYFNKSKNLQILKINKNNKTNKIINKYSQKIGIIFYGEHNLILLSSTINHKNQINISGVTEIPIPTNVIGDTLIEDSNELANILLDSINLLDLSDSPLLVILSSSFFNIHTFLVSDLKQISANDSKVKAKSPYLPANTIIDFLRISDKKLSEGLIRTTYSKQDFINSWTDTLQNN